jgi:hypothetical protein
MTLRQAYAPLQPEFDNFLFAAVGKEIDGIPLSMISVLTQLGFDPWQEAARLASLARREAAEQLAQIIARLPRTPWADDERGEIADDLIELLPRRAKKTDTPGATLSNGSKPRGWTNVPGGAKFWLIGLILGAAILVSVIAQKGLPSGVPEPGPTTEAPRN